MSLSGIFQSRAGLLVLCLMLWSCQDAAPPAGAKLPAEAEAALRLAPKWELFSLDPEVEPDEAKPETFHGWKVLGSVEIKDKSTRQKLLDSLRASVAANPGVVAACFSPRHGIRVKQNGEQHDFVICFQCYHIRWYPHDEPESGFNPTDSPVDAFNSVLQQANVPLPAQPK